jgi:tetratricopeptide (TPR) repeat protein
MPAGVQKTQELNQLIALFNAGRVSDVELGAQAMVKRYPKEGLIWKLLGFSLLMQGKDALVALQKAVDLQPRDAELLNYLGISLTAKEQYAAAEKIFLRALAVNPQYAEALYNLNLAYMALGRFLDAEASLRRAMVVKPDYATAHYGLGLALKAQKRTAEAEISLKQALEIKPDFAGGYYALGCFLSEQERTSDAVDCFMQALSLDPSYTDARRKLGECYAQQGRFEEATNCFSDTLIQSPNDIEAYSALAMIDAKNIDDSALEKLLGIEASVESESIQLSEQDKVLLNSTLATAFDARKDYDAAFHYFLNASRIKRASLNYDANQTIKQFAAIKRLFDKKAINRLSGSGNDSSVPIFILGMPRSGTTLVEQIISSHPDVFGAGELPDLLAVATHDAAEPWLSFPSGLQEIDEVSLLAMGDRYLSKVRQFAHAVGHITDKMPNNFMAVGLIHLMLPNAKIIHVKRNAVDTCLSCFTHVFKGALDFTYDLAELGLYYSEYARLMEHWREVLPLEAFIEVNYEDVVADQEGQARRLIQYCGLEWDERCIKFHENTRSVRTASIVQVRSPIYASSVEKWRRYEKHLAPLFKALES